MDSKTRLSSYRIEFIVLETLHLKLECLSISVTQAGHCLLVNSVY